MIVFFVYCVYVQKFKKLVFGFRLYFLIGNMFCLVGKLGYLVMIELVEEYGKIYMFYLFGGQWCVVINLIDLVCEVLFVRRDEFLG